MADHGQVENALLNLAIDARDAIPDGGKLIIAATNATLDESYVASHTELSPGKYVVLSVSDTGIAMTPEVLDQVFEPFYTTNEVGKGADPPRTWPNCVGGRRRPGRARAD